MTGQITGEKHCLALEIVEDRTCGGKHAKEENSDQACCGLMEVYFLYNYAIFSFLSVALQLF